MVRNGKTSSSRPIFQIIRKQPADTFTLFPEYLIPQGLSTVQAEEKEILRTANPRSLAQETENRNSIPRRQEEPKRHGGTRPEPVQKTGPSPPSYRQPSREQGGKGPLERNRYPETAPETVSTRSEARRSSSGRKEADRSAADRSECQTTRR